MAQLLEGLSGKLLANLQEVLVERNKLTLGKELGRGQFMIPFEVQYNPVFATSSSVQFSSN